VPKRWSNASNIRRKRANVVIANGRWTITATIATLVRNGDLKPRFHQWIDLVPPEIPTLRETVQQNDQGALALNNRA
jgi:hypothetical protein